MDLWGLPTTAVIGSVEYPIHADYRDILNIFRYMDDPDKPEYIKWRIALALFYEGEIPVQDRQEAMEYLADFIACGEQNAKSSTKLLDWEKDAQIIVADVNKVAGAEIRSMPFLHWWTFMAYFNAIGEGQLSTIVSIRDKVAKNKKLEKWEQEYCRKNKERIYLNQRYTSVEEDLLKKWAGG
jgi:hypothetical protein